jgi:hypothetical protein
VVARVTVSKTDFPYTGPYSQSGDGKHKGPTALALKRAMSRAGKLAWEPDVWDDHFNAKLEQALDAFDPGGKNGYATGRYDKVRAAVVPAGKPHTGEPILDSVCLELVRDEHESTSSSSVPNLGPMSSGLASVLDRDLTHATSGIPLYPAFDDVFTAGAILLAPEGMDVTRQSSSSPGCAFYADGDSGLRWWFGHLTATPSVGRRYAKGDKIGNVYDTDAGGGPHVHVGVNVERYPGFGTGDQLKHHTNYTHGAPTIREQLGAV